MVETLGWYVWFHESGEWRVLGEWTHSPWLKLLKHPNKTNQAMKVPYKLRLVPFHPLLCHVWPLSHLALPFSMYLYNTHLRSIVSHVTMELFVSSSFLVGLIEVMFPLLWLLPCIGLAKLYGLSFERKGSKCLPAIE